eukprot:2348349-Rhodomonas_salina.7
MPQLSCVGTYFSASSKVGGSNFGNSAKNRFRAVLLARHVRLCPLNATPGSDRREERARRAIAAQGQLSLNTRVRPTLTRYHRDLQSHDRSVSLTQAPSSASPSSFLKRLLRSGQETLELSSSTHLCDVTA